LQKFRTGLEVESVDGFQGQEKEVIIFCAVRNNRDGKVGFLSDWRRLNVMLTRARRGCIVIGSKTTLNQDPLWQEWLKWATARGAICGESAKGTWVPRYLVDDRDGVWTMKASIVEEASTAAGAGAGGSAASTVAKKEPPKEAEILDSWEDMSDAASPSVTPANNAKPPEPLDAGMVGESLAGMERQPSAGSREPKEERESRAQERREALDAEEVGAQEALRLPERSKAEADAKGAESQPPGRIGPDDKVDDDSRRAGTPSVGPKSPARQLALAKMGLLDDLDLEDS